MISAGGGGGGGVSLSTGSPRASPFTTFGVPDPSVTAGAASGLAELLGSTVSWLPSGVVSMASSSTAATWTATLGAGSPVFVLVIFACICPFASASVSCINASSSRSWFWPTGGGSVVEVLISTSCACWGGEAAAVSVCCR